MACCSTGLLFFLGAHPRRPQNTGPIILSMNMRSDAKPHVGQGQGLDQCPQKPLPWGHAGHLTSPDKVGDVGQQSTELRAKGGKSHMPQCSPASRSVGKQDDFDLCCSKKKTLTGTCAAHVLCHMSQGPDRGSDSLLCSWGSSNKARRAGIWQAPTTYAAEPSTRRGRPSRACPSKCSWHLRPPGSLGAPGSHQ